ncbi:unnamed protein product [Musa banksii]
MTPVESRAVFLGALWSPLVSSISSTTISRSGALFSALSWDPSRDCSCESRCADRPAAVCQLGSWVHVVSPMMGGAIDYFYVLERLGSVAEICEFHGLVRVLCLVKNVECFMQVTCLMISYRDISPR